MRIHGTTSNPSLYQKLGQSNRPRSTKSLDKEKKDNDAEITTQRGDPLDSCYYSFMWYRLRAV